MSTIERLRANASSVNNKAEVDFHRLVSAVGLNTVIDDEEVAETLQRCGKTLDQLEHAVAIFRRRHALRAKHETLAERRAAVAEVEADLARLCQQFKTFQLETMQKEDSLIQRKNEAELQVIAAQAAAKELIQLRPNWLEAAERQTREAIAQDGPKVNHLEERIRTLKGVLHQLRQNRVEVPSNDTRVEELARVERALDEERQRIARLNERLRGIEGLSLCEHPSPRDLDRLPPL